MNRRTIDLAIYGISAACSLSLALTSLVCLIRGIDTVTSNVLFLVFGVMCLIACVKGWRETVQKGGRR